MMHRASVLALLVLTLAAPMGFTQGLGIYDQAPIRHFNDADVKMMMAAIDEALDDSQPKATREWTNGKTGSFGTATVVGSSKGPKGEPCKRLRVSNSTRGGVKGSSSYTFCKIDKQWMISTAP